MKTFFTSDPHFCHHNIIKYTERPFQTYWEMNEKLIKNWNSVVLEEDTVYLLGDIGMGKTWELTQVLFSLNGTIHLIKGNHDKKQLSQPMRNRFASISDYKEIRIPDPEADYRGNNYQKIVLCHYPIHSWNGMHHGSFMLHGHCHGTFYTKDNKILDVGIDCWNYTPVSYEQIKEYMKKREFVPVDGHGKKGVYKCAQYGSTTSR